MNRILVLTPPEDQGCRAIALATELARHTGANLTLLRVLEESAGSSFSVDSMGVQRQLRDLIRDAETREMEKLAQLAMEATEGRVQVDIEVCWGVAFEMVIEIVRRDGCDLVVKPARGLNHAGGVFFGATALNLFRRCPCPVWVVGDDGGLPRRVLLAVDPSLDRTRRDVASRLLAWGESVARVSNASLEVAAAWHAPGADVLKGKIDAEEWERYVRDAHERAEAGLEIILREGPVPSMVECTHLIAGSAREVIPALAESGRFELVIVGTLGRVGIAGELLGETAEIIVRAVQCSVLAVSPSHPIASW